MRPQSECKLGKGPAGPFPLPLSPRSTLQALRASSPQGEPLNLFSLYSEGGEIRKISHAEHRNLLKEGSGAEIGEGACGPLPLAPNPKGTTPQSAAADSSPYTGEPILRCLFGSPVQGELSPKVTEGLPLPLLPLGADFLQPRARGALGFGGAVRADEPPAELVRRCQRRAGAGKHVQHGVARTAGAEDHPPQ